MTFSSSVFLFLFLPVTLLGYYLIRRELRNAFLTVMSLGFYAWGEPKFVLVMLASILLNYLAGVGIDRAKGKGLRRTLMILSVLVNLGVLFVFKYLDFTISTVNRLTGAGIPLRHIALPIGISFFTFQGMSYVLDLYMGRVPVQRNPLHVALYISMFPQLIAGPIVRYSDINAQITSRELNVDRFASGVRRFIVGLAKKMILANFTAAVVDEVFGLAPDRLQVATTWLGAVCYAMQIYFDFSGYSDMAIGLGRMFGFEFMENFNYPYIARSVTDFWRRWHISLSSWFKDYLYIPMGGSRRGNVYLHLMVVFLATGIWHGAAWTFVLWGVWHGLFRIIERAADKAGHPVFARLPVLGWLYTMLVALLGWVLFRADSIGYAARYIGRMFGLVGATGVNYTLSWFLTPRTMLILAACFLACVPWRQLLPRAFAWVESHTAGAVLRDVLLAALMVVSIMLVMTSTYNPFIYFRF